MSDAPFSGPSALAEMIAGVRRLVAPDTAPAGGGDGAGVEGAGVEGAGVEGAAEAEEQWRELATAVDELVEVVLVQQDLIENLLTRMSRLEGRDVSRRKERRGA